MTKTRDATVLIAAILMGTLAGFFITYGFTIMPALATVDDRTFVSAFQGLERMFGNPDYGFNWPVFLGYFLGPIVIAVAIVMNRKQPSQRWLVAALALALVSVAVTQIFNVPPNNALTAAGDPNSIDVAQVRLDFQEDRWRTWNHVRSATTLAAFVCLTWALFRHGPRNENRLGSSPTTLTAPL